MNLKKTKLLVFTLFVLFFTWGCTIGPTHGMLFTMNSFAGEFNPSNNARPINKATGCQHYVLYLLALGDAGAGQIANKGGIKRIAHIDHSTIGVLLGLYSNYCTTVYGE